MVGEGVWSGKEAARNMDDLEVEVCEVEQPLSLRVVEVLGLMEVHQVLVICENLDGKRGSME